MSKLSKRSIIKNSGRDDWNEDYIDPREDPSHPGYETALKRENDVYREFLKSQPKKEGKEISICPNCFKVFKEREVNINPLSEWAFKDGIATTKTSRGCPVCDPKNYDESKDPNSELAIAKQKEEVPTIEEEYWADDKKHEKTKYNVGITSEREKLFLADKIKSIMKKQRDKDIFHIWETITKRAWPQEINDILITLQKLINNPPKKDDPWFYDVPNAGHFFGVGSSIRSYRGKDMTKTVSPEQREEMFKKVRLNDKSKEKRSSLNEDLGKIFKTAEIQEQDNLGARLKEEELLEKKDFDPADITLVQHLKDSLKTLINSSQHLFELNLLTPEELNVIRTIEENMDDYLIAEQWSKMAKLKAFLKIINSNVRNRTILKLGQLRG